MLLYWEWHPCTELWWSASKQFRCVYIYKALDRLNYSPPLPLKYQLIIKLSCELLLRSSSQRKRVTSNSQLMKQAKRTGLDYHLFSTPPPKERQSQLGGYAQDNTPTATANSLTDYCSSQCYPLPFLWRWLRSEYLESRHQARGVAILKQSPRYPALTDGEEGAFSISSSKSFVPNHSKLGTGCCARHQLQPCARMEIQSTHLASREDDVRK